jgi:hypothetical protein
MWKEKELLNPFQITLNTRVRVVLSKQGAERLRRASRGQLELLGINTDARTAGEGDVLTCKLWRLCAVFGEKGTRPFKKMEVLDEIVWEEPIPDPEAIFYLAV